MDKDGELQSDLDLVFNISYSVFSPIVDLQNHINNDSPIEHGSPAFPAEFLTAKLPIASTMARMSQTINKKTTTMHVENEYGQEIAKLLAMDDLRGETCIADNKKLKKAILFAHSQARPPILPAPQDEPRFDPDRRGNNTSSKPKAERLLDSTCFVCKKKGHFFKSCPSFAR
jgi:hypothetical protein